MFAKAFVVIIVLIAIAAALLSLRASRLDAMHQMSALYGQTKDTKLQMWNLQTKIAKQTNPNALHKKLSQTNLKMTLQTVGHNNRP